MKGAGGFILFSEFFCTSSCYVDYVKPFWTEKSSCIEGDRLHVVVVAPSAPSIEFGRMHARDNGKRDVMSFIQISGLEGLVINTQMTYEEKVDDQYNVYRLM